LKVGDLSRVKPLDEKQSVSVVVVTYNCGAWVSKCLDSILRTAFETFEVIVLDNGSRDDTLSKLSRYEGQVKLVQLDKNLGLAKARNIGARMANGSYLAFVDHDTAVDSSWLQAGVQELTRYPQAGIVMFRALSLKDPRVISETGAGIGAHGSDLTGLPAESFTGIRHVLFPLGAGFIVSKAVFMELGGFDEFFFVGNDDIDFGWRAWLLGFEPICISTGTVYHDGGVLRRNGFSRVFRFYGIRNWLYLYMKNLSVRTLLTNLPLIAIGFPLAAIYRVGFDGVRAIYSVLFKELRPIYANRVRTQRVRTVKDARLMPYIERYMPTTEYSRDWRVLIAGFERRLINGTRRWLNSIGT